MNGNDSYEGLPIRPDGGIWWKIGEQFRPTVMFTSPTAIRTLKKQGSGPISRSMTQARLRYLFLALANRWMNQPGSGFTRR